MSLAWYFRAYLAALHADQGDPQSHTPLRGTVLKKITA
jgi:hypothetical protein